MPRRARDFVQHPLRSRGARPQLKRDPLGGCAISTLPQQAGDWLRDKSVLVGSPNWMRQNRAWIREAESDRPGSSDMLRVAALEWLNALDSDCVRKGIAVLAVVGTSDDVPALRRRAAPGGGFEADGQAAIGEIESRLAAGQEPLEVLRGPSLRTRVIRSVAGFFGVGSVLLGLTGLVRLLLRTGPVHLPFLLRGLSVIGFGCWMLWIARRGKLPHELP